MADKDDYGRNEGFAFKAVPPPAQPAAKKDGDDASGPVEVLKRPEPAVSKEQVEADFGRAPPPPAPPPPKEEKTKSFGLSM